jgi:uncharacterized protein
VTAADSSSDSLALMAFAHRHHARDVEAVHAVSPAVPPASTARVRALAQERGWQLRMVDAGETSDDAYLANPVDRCRVCKSHLYDALGAIASTSQRLVVSGTNLDDLDDYRPGLQAAAARGVRHPFVDAKIDKRGVRALARALDLGDVAELPAQPCLASRVETGIRIDAPMLRMIDDVENAARARLGANVTLRCRVRAQGVVLEIDEHVLARLDDTTRAALLSLAPRASLAPYRMGSAFLRVM